MADIKRYFEITPESWEEAKNLKHLLSQCIFRGQKDAGWQLTTTLERAANQFHVPPEELWQREKYIIRQFRSQAHQYISTLPRDDDLVEWLSLIQHYGGPTRLLDFTRSFYIASFFALEEADKDASIWGIDFLYPMVKAFSHNLYIQKQQMAC